MTGADLDPRVVRTREVVVRAAAELLAEVGFERICIDAVAERSGVARSTIYRNWPQRTALFVESFDRICARGPGSIEPTGDLRHDLETLGRGLVEQLHAEDWGRIMPSLISAATHDDELGEVMAAFAARRAAQAAAIVRHAVSQGGLEPPDDVDAALERFVSPFFFRRLITRLPLDEGFLQRQVDAALRDLDAH